MTDPDLVVLFADLDAQRFVSTLIERGFESGCLRRFALEVVRDPMCDAHVVREPLVALGPYLQHPGTRFLVLWDHMGSGMEDRAPADCEQRVVECFARAGVHSHRVAAIAFVPELEAALEPGWDRVLEVLAGKRKESPREIAFQPADPKAAVREATAAHRLKADASLFRELAGTLSLPKLKQGASLARIADRLAGWFGA